jgi:hypothetical protein
VSWLYQPITPASPIFATPATPGVGPAGAATFAMLIESGAKVTYSWQTNVLKAWSGLEQRVATLGAPRQRYECVSLLTDAQWRVILSSLVANAATAQPFLLGLTYEALPVTGGGGHNVSVPSTSLSDWLVAGQRAVVVSPDQNTVIGCVVQSATGTTITMDVDVSAAALSGGIVAPAMAVFLDAQQDFKRYAVNVGPWTLKARALLYGFANSMIMGVGATVNTYASMPLWDRGTVIRDTVSQPLDSGVDLVDLGGVVADISGWSVSDWGLQLEIQSAAPADFQWLKAFLSTVRGMQVSFLAPTWRPDLIPIGDASSGTLKVSADAQYATTWFTSLAHRRIQLKMTNGTIVYRTVSTAVDNGDGTQSLGLDSAASGAIAMVSYLETCRLTSDDAAVSWDGAVMSCTLNARVVQQ